MNIDELQKMIFDAGIVGAGGAGFPTHKKMAPQGVETILVNAAECEPLLKVDYFLVNEYLDKMVRALECLLDATGAKEGIIGIKGKNIKSDRVKNLKNDRIRVQEIPDIYPVGDEVILTYEVLGKIVPEGRIPLSVGVVIVNAETLLNIAQAMDGHPVTEKYVSVAGDVEKTVTLLVPVGMAILDVLKLAGVNDLTGKRVINGGPLMGNIIDPATSVVTKTTKGLIILPQDHVLIQKKTLKPNIALKRASAACCQCSMCSDMCPRHLLGYQFDVHKTIRAVANRNVTDSNVYLQNYLCCSCGICDYIACTQDICPRVVASEVKTQLGKAGLRREGGYQPPHVRPERENRLVSSHRIMERVNLLQYYEHPSEFYPQFCPTDTVTIQMSQHIGKPCTPTVKVGQKVKKGDIVGSVKFEEMGTNVHSSMDGTVTKVDSKYVIIEK